MFKRLRLKPFLLTLLLVSVACASSPFQWSGDVSSHINSYQSEFAHFRKNICVPMAEMKFNELLKRYRGEGVWIPEIEDNLDRETIILLLPEIEKKLAWIQQELQKRKTHKFPSPQEIISLKKDYKKYLELRTAYFFADSLSQNNIKAQIAAVVKKMVKEFERLMNQNSFLTNYKFPVDHLKNRMTYDRLKDKKDIESKRMSNYAYFYRKILEDGTYHKDRSSPDLFFRTLLDTLSLELQKSSDVLSEDARIDLEFFIEQWPKQIEQGKEKWIGRLEEWLERTEKTIVFYKSLVEGEDAHTRSKEILKQMHESNKALKDFVYTKQAEVYRYWQSRPDLLKAIFVIETILLNEIGTLDSYDGLERMDVIRVILNRLSNPKYLSIDKKDHIYPYLSKVTSKFHMQNDHWLGALFKQGEFSFTYFYLPGVVNIFCPDISKKAQKLRTKNIELALLVLKEKERNFPATRYFSRVSMTGRIHMDSVWDDYKVYPERVGPLLANQSEWGQKLSKKELSYLYSFIDPEQKENHVFRSHKETVVMREWEKQKLFFSYRDPQLFRYFVPTP